jgi:DNA polymerase III delta prime subunit
MDFTRLWLDIHRPQSLSELTFNPELTQTLKQLAQCDDLPHLIFYGPPGVGKKTRAMALLNEIYGKGVFKFNKENWTKKINSTEIDVTYLLPIRSLCLRANSTLISPHLMQETMTSSSFRI